MRFTTIVSAAAFASLSLAQSASGPGQGCAGQNVLVSCLGTQAGRIATCGPLDYACQCLIQKDVLMCYDQCPNDINRSSEEAKLTAYCVAASATMTTPEPTNTGSTFVVKTSTPAATQTGSDNAEETGTESESESPSETESAPGGATTTGNAGSGADKVTWMCASSLLAVLTAAFMAL